MKDNVFYPQGSLNFNGNLMNLAQPRVMGILNITPDSFFEDSRANGMQSALDKAGQMIEHGASILDIGGVSTRPGASSISEQEEADRILPVIENLAQHFDTVLSIDTWRASIAKQAVGAGAGMINDISGGTFDAEMLQTVASLNVPYCLMHTQGTPEQMQQNPVYKDVVSEILHFLSGQVQKLRNMGMHDIIIDPGFGFGKTLEHNYQLLNGLAQFQLLECPVLVGFSRKSMINKVLGTSPADALNGTTALHVLALERGASILRVHDVKEAVEAVKIVNFARSTER